MAIDLISKDSEKNMVLMNNKTKGYLNKSSFKTCNMDRTAIAHQNIDMLHVSNDCSKGNNF